MKHLFFKLSLIYILLNSFTTQADTIRVRGSQSQYDSTHDYYVGLIKLAYSKIDTPLTIKFSPYMVQERALSEMQAGRVIDLYWAGTNFEREDKLGFVPIPLVKGLLGYRVFTIHKSASKKFSSVKSIDDLKKLSLCQGAHWPDTDIMLASGLDVLPNMVYENMFRQVYSGRCEAFPRGINEAYSEVESRKVVMPKLIVFDDVILHYPFPMYFFTYKENNKLIDNLTKGLYLSIEDGSFDQYIQTHEATRHLFPLTKWKNKHIISIKNPFLSEKANPNDQKLWFNLLDLE